MSQHFGSLLLDEERPTAEAARADRMINQTLKLA
jgi:hypothetical protein